MKSNTFGLDIGTSFVKLVWLDEEKDTFAYHTSAYAPTLTQGMQSESPFDQQEMAQFLNKLVIDANVRTNNVNIALPESHVYTKVIEMPILSDKELQTAIFWEAEQYIPAPMDSINLDWSIVRKPKENLPSQKMQVLLVAAPKQLLQRYQTIISMAGLSLTAVETEILAVTRGIIGKSAEHFPTSLIMNMGALSSSFAILQDGVIVFTYTIPLGGVAMTRAIAADFGFSPQQAEEYKKVYGLSDSNLGGKIKTAIGPILESILSDIKKALTFYNEKYKNEMPISQLLLTGGSSLLPGLGVYITQNLGIETVIADPWKMSNIQNVPKEVDASGPSYTLALGLAMKEYE